MLAERVSGHAEVVVRDELLPGGNVPELVAWTARQAERHERIAWVGHAPDVSQYAAALIGQGQASIRFGKGAICLIRFPGPPQLGGGELRWLVTAKVLGALTWRAVHSEPPGLSRRFGGALPRRRATAGINPAARWFRSRNQPRRPKSAQGHGDHGPLPGDSFLVGRRRGLRGQDLLVRHAQGPQDADRHDRIAQRVHVAPSTVNHQVLLSGGNGCFKTPRSLACRSTSAN